MEAEHPSHADRHVGIGGEVEIDLQRIADRAKPGRGRAAHCARHGENRIRLLPKGVGQQELFPETHDEALNAGIDLIEILPAGYDLRSNGLIAYDRAGHKLREETYVKRHVEEILLRLDRSPVHVNDVAHALKGEKRDADRHDHLQDRKVCVKQGIRRDQQPVSILVVDKRSQTGQQLQPQTEAADRFRSGAVNDPGAAVAHQDHREHQQNAPALAPKIEEQGKDQQHQIAKAAEALRHNKVAKADGGKEKHQKGKTAENHARTSFTQ